MTGILDKIDTDYPAHTFAWKGSTCNIYLYRVKDGHDFVQGIRADCVVFGCLLDNLQVSRTFSTEFFLSAVRPGFMVESILKLSIQRFINMN